MARRRKGRNRRMKASKSGPRRNARSLRQLVGDRL